MALSTQSDFELIDPSQFSSLISGKIVDQYFQLVVVTVLSYDAAITLEKEAKYFWKIPKSGVDFAYLCIRYIGILGSVSHLFWDSYHASLPLCNFSSWMRNTANWVSVFLIDYILVIRVLALYLEERKLSVFLKTLLGLQAACRLGFMIYFSVLEHVAVGGLSNGVTLCGVDFFPPWQLGLIQWTIPMAFGVILIILALFKAAEYWKMSAGFKGFALVKVLIRDQVLYFTIVIASSLFNVVQYKLEFENDFLSNVFNCLGNPAFLTVLGSRMLINMKEAGERGQNQGTSYTLQSTTISEMEFS